MKDELIYAIIILEFILIIIILMQAISAQEYPKIQPYVNDFGGYLDSKQIESLNLRCQAIEQNTSYEIAIVIVNTTNGQDRLEFANRIGEENGVGKSEEDNGLILLWTQEDEKGIAIAVGRGAESIFNDAKVSRYARDARPLFDEGKYYEGFNKMLDDIEVELKTKSEPVILTTGDNLTDLIILIGIFLLIIWIILRIFFSESSDGGFGTGVVIGSILSSGSGGGGGFSGGFSGGSFGGGGGRG